MKLFVDTSVLIPLFYGDHPHHDDSVRVLDNLGPDDIVLRGAHSLVETYSTRTRMPGNYRTSADRARLFIADLAGKFKTVALMETEYAAMLYRFAAIGIVGGAIYDALLSRCAMRADVDVLLTWNSRHFAQLGEDVAKIVKTPVEFSMSSL